MSRRCVVFAAGDRSSGRPNPPKSGSSAAHHPPLRRGGKERASVVAAVIPVPWPSFTPPNIGRTAGSTRRSIPPRPGPSPKASAIAPSSSRPPSSGGASFVLLRFSIAQSGGSPNSKANIAMTGAGGIAGTAYGSCCEENVVGLCAVDKTTVDQLKKISPALAAARKFADFRVMLDKMGEQIDADCSNSPERTHFTGPAAKPTRSRTTAPTIRVGPTSRKKGAAPKRHAAGGQVSPRKGRAPPRMDRPDHGKDSRHGRKLRACRTTD